MLIQFNFENFKSFLHEVSLDMTAIPLKEHTYNLITDDVLKDNYIKVAAIYGANASGKSSIIDAFHFMAAFVCSSFKVAAELKEIPLKCFAFTKKPKNSTFEVFFQKNGFEYQYGFVVNRKSIVEEWLYRKELRPNSDYTIVFDRQGDDFNIPDLTSAKNFVDMVMPKTLFLSILSNAKIPVIKEVYEWFEDASVIDFGDVSFENRLNSSLPSEIEKRSFQNEIIQFLNAIGVPIDDLDVRLEKDNDEEYYRLYSVYNYNGRTVKLPFPEESSGTIKMFTLFIRMKNVLSKGSVIFIDELDAKLHPLLLRYVVTMFHDEKTNPNNAQLIYTTHDNYTLTKDLFRRDQIWFVEKQKDLTAELYSLAEYKLDENSQVQTDTSYNKDYLLGRYGGVPVLKEFDMWGETNEGE